MKYTHYKKDMEISRLGFGLMRLPCVDGASNEIDFPKAEEMFLKAVEAGINYFDNAYVYHSGKSEVFWGEVVKKHNLRDKIYVADKMPTFQCDSHFEAYQRTVTQLQRTGFEYFDFYLLHALNQDLWKKVIDLDLLKYMQQLKKDGIARNLGFSFHDDFDVFKEIIDAFPWDFCQIQLNFIDKDFQAGLKGLAYAKEKGIPVVIMEPLKGGKITAANGEEIEQIKQKNNVENIDMASLCLRWLYEKENILTVLSGMSSLRQIQENILTASNPMPITKDEEHFMEEFASFLSSRQAIPCTGCGYCEEKCPGKMDISAIFEKWNDSVMFGSTPHMPGLGEFTRKGCLHCSLCNTVCPQHLSVEEKLEEAIRYLTQK